MSHVDSQTLADLAAGKSLSQRAITHIDGCVTCRRAAAERGASGASITAAVAVASRSRYRRLAAVAALGACVTVAGIAVPLRSAALGFVSVFEPHSVAAVPLTVDDLRTLGHMPDLSAYASTRELRASSTTTVTDARAAAAAAGFVPRVPTYAPGGARALSFTVNGPSAQLLRFTNPQRRANASAALPPLPADIAGSTMEIDLGATTIATYATGATAADVERVRRAIERMSPSSARASSAGASASAPITSARTSSVGPASGVVPAPLVRRTVATTTRTAPVVVAFGVGTRGANTETTGNVTVVHGVPPTHGFLFSNGAGTMPLVVVQMPVPRIVSTGVSVGRIMAFMLEQPGIPPRVAAAFGALGDPSTTLPIPVPIDKAYTQPVFVDGVQGVGIGDDTGLGAGVIWQKNGMLYAVFATQTAREVLAIANSLR